MPWIKQHEIHNRLIVDQIKSEYVMHEIMQPEPENHPDIVYVQMPG